MIILTLNVVAYGSYGRGGGTGDIGRGRVRLFKRENGHVDFDKIVAYNCLSRCKWLWEFWRLI